MDHTLIGFERSSRHHHEFGQTRIAQDCKQIDACLCCDRLGFSIPMQELLGSNRNLAENRKLRKLIGKLPYDKGMQNFIDGHLLRINHVP